MNINNTSFPENMQLLIQASQALSDHSSLGYDSIPSSNHQSINRKTSSVALTINSRDKDSSLNQYSEISGKKNKDKRKFFTEEDELESKRKLNKEAAERYRAREKLKIEAMQKLINSLIENTKSDESISSHDSLSPPSSITVLNQRPSQTSIPDLFYQTRRTVEPNPTAALNSREHNKSSLKEESSFSPVKRRRNKRKFLTGEEKLKHQRQLNKEAVARYRAREKLKIEAMQKLINSLIENTKSDESISPHDSLSSPSYITFLNQRPSSTSISDLFYQTGPGPTAALNSEVHNESSLKEESSFSPVAVTNENNVGSVDDVD